MTADNRQQTTVESQPDKQWFAPMVPCTNAPIGGEQHMQSVGSGILVCFFTMLYPNIHHFLHDKTVAVFVYKAFFKQGLSLRAGQNTRDIAEQTQTLDGQRCRTL